MFKFVSMISLSLGNKVHINIKLRYFIKSQKGTLTL